jgi:hypothetical protein
MKDRTLAYTAGIVDAEGCITICKKPQGDGFCYGAVVTVANNSRRLMRWLVANFGGNFGKLVDHRTNPPSIGYRWWTVNNSHTSRFLDLISPFLVLKEKQANLLRSFINLGNVSCPDIREDFFKKVKDLKSVICVTTEVPDSLVKGKLLNSYLAGFIDGDGFIQIGEHHHVGRLSVIQPVLGVGCTERFVPYQLQKLFGGSFREYASRGANLRNVFASRISRKENLEKCLLYLLPYLIVRRAFAKVVLDFCRMPFGRSPEMRNKRVGLLNEYRQLKIQSKLTGDCERRPMKT